MAVNTISTSMGMRMLKPLTWMSCSSMMFSRPTWMRGWRSGSSLMAKMPRCVRGMMPKWITSSSAYVSFCVAALMGSMSPIRSAMDVSGVASFSP